MLQMNVMSSLLLSVILFAGKILTNFLGETKRIDRDHERKNVLVCKLSGGYYIYKTLLTNH